MLATLTEDYFDHKNWIYERKLDGVRAVTFKFGDGIWIKSRNHNKLNNTYPELVDALEKQPDAPFVADGEIVAFEGDRTSFSKLQNRMNISDPQRARNIDVEIYLYLFDLIYLSEYDLTKLDLRTRKKLLKQALKFEDPVRYMPHINEEGISFLIDACNKGWEGVIAKDGRSQYNQSRSKKWLKFKCSKRQELVIGGYTDPQGERIGFGALLLGYYQNGDLIYAGQVGTGFSNKQLQELHEKLTAIERDNNPFKQNNISKKGVHWVDPEMIAEIGFTEWTDKNKLRHPRFLGLRYDKKATTVNKES